MNLIAVFNRVAPFLKNTNGVVIVDSFEGLPMKVKDDANKQGSNGNDVDGVSHTGKIYIVRDRVASEEDAETLLFHEATHRGVGVIMEIKASVKAGSDLTLQYYPTLKVC